MVLLIISVLPLGAAPSTINETQLRMGGGAADAGIDGAARAGTAGARSYAARAASTIAPMAPSIPASSPVSQKQRKKQDNNANTAKSRVHFAEKRVVRQFGKKTRNIIGRDRLENATTKNSDPENA